MGKKDFCGVGNYPVLIPYEELEKLLKIAQNYEESQKQYEKRLSRMDEKFSALQLMYAELLDKLRELEEMI